MHSILEHFEQVLCKNHCKFPSKWGMSSEYSWCSLGITWVVVASTHKSDLWNIIYILGSTLIYAYICIVYVYMYINFFSRKLDDSAQIIPSITSFHFFRTDFFLSEVNYSHNVFLRLCPLCHSGVFFFLPEYFVSLFNFSATWDFPFFNLKDRILDDRVCKVEPSCWKISFHDLKMVFCYNLKNLIPCNMDIFWCVFKGAFGCHLDICFAKML